MKKTLILICILLLSTISVSASIEYINHIRDIKVYSQLIMINSGSENADISYIKKKRRLYVQHIDVPNYQNIYNLTQLKRYINTLYKGNTIIVYSDKEPLIAIGIANFLKKENPSLDFKVLEKYFDY